MFQIEEKIFPVPFEYSVALMEYFGDKVKTTKDQFSAGLNKRTQN